jgi:hypothetical protein
VVGKSDSISIGQGLRRIDPSYLGNLSLVSSSATNPGITVTIIPFAKIHLNEKTSSFEFNRSNNED